MRILILGNAGSGKTTMARALCAQSDATHLSLDDLAFQEGAQRRPLRESIADLQRFLADHDNWVIEGCYADLAEAALPHAEELRFLNPGVEACVRNCRGRPWEPGKFPTPQAQNDMLEPLIAWVRQYETRTDEYGLTRHRALYDNFKGPKREYTRLPP